LIFGQNERVREITIDCREKGKKLKKLKIKVKKIKIKILNKMYQFAESSGLFL
jgi:hypothetical protein